MTRKLAGIAAMVMIMLGTCLAGSPEGSVAVVNMEKLLKAHPDSASAEAAFRKQIKEFDLEQQDMIAELEEAQQAVEDARTEAASPILSNEGREEKKALVERRKAALQRKRRMLAETLHLRQKQIADQEIRMRNRIVRKIREHIEAVAAKKGISLVVDSSAVGAQGAPVVAYSKEEQDLTAEILARIQNAGKTKETGDKSRESE